MYCLKVKDYDIYFADEGFNEEFSAVEVKRQKSKSGCDVNLRYMKDVDEFGCSNDYTDSIEGSPDGQTIDDVKLALKDEVENESISQAIVFSLLQKQRHPNLAQHLVPHILICKKYFRIVMYDAQNDILLRSSDCQLMSASNDISCQSITILWMVLHYRLFCSGLSSDSLQVKLDELKSGFREEMQTCWDLYSSHLKSGIDSFSHVRKIDVPDEYTSCVYNI